MDSLASFLSFGVISEKSNMCRCCSFHEFSKKITNNVLGVTYLCNMSAMQLYQKQYVLGLTSGDQMFLLSGYMVFFKIVH